MDGSATTTAYIAWQNKEPQAEEILYALVYERLKELARAKKARNQEKFGADEFEKLHQMNNTTVLVNEAYIRMATMDREAVTSKRHFFVMVSTLIGQVLIDTARSAKRKKRLEESSVTEQESTELEPLVVIDQLLDRLSNKYPNQVDAYRLQKFVGLSVQELSDTFQCSMSKIEKDLQFTQGWLKRSLLAA